LIKAKTLDRGRGIARIGYSSSASASGAAHSSSFRCPLGGFSGRFGGYGYGYGHGGMGIIGIILIIILVLFLLGRI
jgi:hypothetical protein